MSETKPYNDFTLMFQGPLHKNFVYGLLNNYKEYTDHIIISHWDTDDVELLDYLTEYNIKHTLVTNTFKKNYTAYQNQNVFYQVYTSLKGLEKVTTPFVLKMRTDQWFGNLEPMFDRVRKNPTKYVCSNLHFRPDKLLKYHPSDKLVGGNTTDLTNTFRIAVDRCMNHQLPLMAGAYMFTEDRSIIAEDDMLVDVGMYTYADINRKLVTQYPEKPLIGTCQILPAGYIGVVPEVLIGTSYLMARGIYPSPKDSIRIVKDNFDIVRVEDMTPYINKEGDNHIEHNSQEIDTIEDYNK